MHTKYYIQLQHYECANEQYETYHYPRDKFKPKKLKSCLSTLITNTDPSIESNKNYNSYFYHTNFYPHSYTITNNNKRKYNLNTNRCLTSVLLFE